jgi:hypothetical protein
MKSLKRAVLIKRWQAGTIGTVLAAAGFFVSESIESKNPGTSEARQVISHAYDLKTGQYIYSEYHFEHYVNGRHTHSIVEYRTPDRVLARKTISFAQSRTAPDFRLEDLRSGYVEGAQAVPGGYKLFMRKDRSQPVREKVISIPSPAVIDGGFDYFVRDNLARLSSGERMTIHFGSSYQQDFFRFDVYKTADGEFKGRRAVFLNVEISNFLLKGLVDPIKLVYDASSGRLLSFSGVSNVNDETGKSYRARIDFVL